MFSEGIYLEAVASLLHIPISPSKFEGVVPFMARMINGAPEAGQKTPA